MSEYCNNGFLSLLDEKKANGPPNDRVYSDDAVVVVPTKYVEPKKPKKQTDTELYALTLTFDKRKRKTTHEYVFEIIQFMIKLMCSKHNVKGCIELTKEGMPHAHLEVETLHSNNYKSELNYWRRRNGYVMNKVIFDREGWTNKYMTKDNFIKDVYHEDIKIIDNNNIFRLRRIVSEYDMREIRIQKQQDEYEHRRRTIYDYI